MALSLILSLEVWRERSVEGRSVEGSRGNVNLHFVWMFLKLSTGEGNNLSFIVCNFVNMVRVNLVIHLVKHFYALLSLQISPIWEN